MWGHYKYMSYILVRNYYKKRRSWRSLYNKETQQNPNMSHRRMAIIVHKNISLICVLER
jgi:hypothetical protein